MSRTIRQDRDGDAVVISHDEQGTWIEVQERVGHLPVNVSACGPLSREAVDDIRKKLSRASGRMVIARCLVWPVAAAGPAAWLAGASWGEIVGPWTGAALVACTAAFTLLHADD